MFVKPAPGALLRDPITMAKLPPEGATVPRDSHWLRAVARGDAIEAAAIETIAPSPRTTPPAPAAAAAAASKPSGRNKE